MKISLVVSYYKNLANLELILLGLMKQSDQNFEVIIAEDDSNAETVEFIDRWSKKVSFTLHHVAQEVDDGFRKNQMLNQAIKKSEEKALVFIDGDCIPHRHFITAYQNSIAKGKILFGKRVNLGPYISQKILNEMSLSRLSIFSILFSDSDKKKEGIYLPFLSLKFKNTHLLGCNWGVLKEHLLEINGYDEDYTAAGVGEDVDIEWRLTTLGLKMVSMKNKAIVYHVFHEKGYTDVSVQANYRLLERKKQAGNIKCVNGLEKIEFLKGQ